MRWCLYSLVSALMLSLSVAAAPAAANEPLPTVFAVDDQRLIREYAQAFKAAMDGSCYVLLAMVKPEEIDWGTPPIGMLSDDTPDFTESYKTRWRMYAAIHMYDRALCVPFDPTRAIVAFERWETEISRTGKGPARAKLELAWRLWEGFGAPMDRARARVLIREAMLLFASSPVTLEGATLGTKSILGHPLPEPAQRYWAWLQKHSKTREDLWNFTKALHDGTLIGPGGETVPSYPYAAALLFDEFPRMAEAFYHLAFLWRDGVMGPEYQADWDHQLHFAADCHYAPAVPVYVQHLLDTESEYDDFPALLALRLLWRLQRQGEDHLAEIERLERDYDIDWYRGEKLERGIAFRLSPPEACESLSPEFFSLWDHLNLDEVMGYETTE